MDKSDLKNGMSFKTRYGDKYYIINSKVYGNSDKDESTLGLWGSLEECLESYDDKLLVLYASPHGADIMEVYDIENNLVWERDEIDWTSIPIGAQVLVKQTKESGWEKRFFVRYAPNDELKFKTLTEGLYDVMSWKYCKLAETEEELTAEKLSRRFFSNCRKSKKCEECKYYEENNYADDIDVGDCGCQYAWLLDNYNITKK